MNKKAIVLQISDYRTVVLPFSIENLNIINQLRVAEVENNYTSPTTYTFLKQDVKYPIVIIDYAAIKEINTNES